MTSSYAIVKPALEVLILAPRDGEAGLIANVLGEADLRAQVCATLPMLAQRIRDGAGAAIVAEEALGDDPGELLAALHDQEPWSDFPLVILTEGGRQPVAADDALCNASLLPTSWTPQSLVSLVRVALRSRRRQYQLQARLQVQQQRAAEVLEGIFDGYLSMDWQWRCTYVNGRGAALLNHRREDIIGKDMREVMPHWRADGFQAKVQQVIDTGQPFSTEELCAINNVWFNVRCSRSVDGLSFFYCDITERKEAEARRARAERNLQDARDRLALALHSTQTGLWDWNLEMGELQWSAEQEVILGLAPGTPATYEVFLERVHPDDREAVRDMVRRSLDPAVREIYEARYRILRPDGVLRWVLARGQVYFDEAVPTRFIGTTVDITAEKAAEDHLRLLVNELSHRVKNTLAVVQTIADQTFKSGGGLDAVHQAFAGRLHALAETHSLLTASKWESVDLATLVGQSLGHMVSGGGARVTASGDEVHLNPKASLAIGMILHELSTNAAKYGALARDRGWVDVRWRLDHGDLVIDWQEHGAEGVTRPIRKGFGTKLIRQSIEYDLGGEIDLDYRPGGLACRMILPRQAVLAH